MNVYFDTEFTGLVPNTTLISIGLVSETGRAFYGEFTDYAENLVDDWIKENVIQNLATNDLSFEFELRDDPNIEYWTGDSGFIKKMLELWLHKVRIESGNARIQLVSDACHYDMALLCNLFGGAFKIPSFVNPVCYDICQDIKEFIDGAGNNYVCARTMSFAFDLSREDFLKDHAVELPKGKKHNSLYDAKVIKLLYEFFYSAKHMPEVHYNENRYGDPLYLHHYDTWFMEKIRSRNDKK